MNLPLSFIQHTQSILGDQWEAFEKALSAPSPVSIRLNPVKARSKSFATDGITPVPWSEFGFYLPVRPPFTFDPLFHAGVYYVQEASSMFVEQVFRQHVSGSVRVLDLCAAPGGKSTHIASLLDGDSLLVSNEVIASRANILLDNVMKSGFDNVVVTNNDPLALGKLGAAFDVVLVDAPCSGEGMFRKDADSVFEWSDGNVQLCCERQQRIVSDVWPALKEDGLLIYSTCTYNLHENEENVRWIMDNLGAEVVELQIDENWKVTSSLSPESKVAVSRFLPHRTHGEGFFLAVLRKTSEAEGLAFSKKKDKKQKAKPIPVPAGLKQLVLHPERYAFQEINGKWRAYAPQVAAFLEQSDGLKILNAGIFLGEQKGKDLVVSHALALCNELNANAFPSENVDRKTAINYLRKEPVFLPDAPTGYVLLVYESSPIGFVKNIGNRTNNLLPNEWRIKSSYLPDQNPIWLK
ncbi:MAG: tRNA and rRNA cytosine-C5-methylase [Bacteroidetes bacterium]|nr:tRNA and rRNA cytosine-C5-methylase [Bacteroidota bacterium]